MAIRVLTRRHFHHILSDFPEIPSVSFRKTRSFSNSSGFRPIIPAESLGNSQFRQQISHANLLQRYGFPPANLHEFIQKNRFLLKFSSSDLEKCIRILLSFGLSQKSLISTLSTCPRALELGFLEKWQLGFSELGFSTVPPCLVQMVLEQSRRSSIEPDDLRRRVLAMKNMGCSDDTVIRVLEELPATLTRDSIDLSHRIAFLKGIGIKRDEIDRVCYLCPGFLAFGIEDRLRLLFEEFEDLGFSKIEIRRLVVDNPRLLLDLEVGELSRCMELLKNLKCRLPIKERILCKGPLRAAVDVKLRVDCLCRHGLIRRDAFKVLWEEPRLILYELEDIEKKIEFLLHKIGFSIECLVDVPEYLGVNLEKQIIPRYNVIEYLRSKGGLGFQVGLKELIKPTRLKFYNLFVKPYPECEKIFGGLVRDVVVKASYPSGLWKQFKPQKFSDSEEDVRNMKLFMESQV